MTFAKTLLAAGTSFSLLAVPALAANDAATQLLPPPPAVTQADNPVATAQAAVETARAELRAAMASGQGVDATRQKLRDALKALAEAQAAAGQQPTTPPAATEPAAPPAAETTPPAPPPTPPAPRAVEKVTPPAPTNKTPPPPPPPAVTPPAPAVDTPPATDQVAPPAPTDQTAPNGQGKPRNKGKSPETPATVPTPPPANTTTTPPPPAGTTPTPPVTVAPQNVAPPSAEQAQPTAQPTTPPAPPPVIALPPPVVVTPPPPPPPAATQGNFDLKKFHTRPKFGEAPPAQAAAPAPVLPKTEDALKEGAVVTAPDGRVIIKEGGQVTVTHDDSGRFMEQGGKIQSARSPNGNITTTVGRPDGMQIVTVRDASGDIIQRYRKKPDGSIEVLIGGAQQQTGILDRMLGRGNQPPPPPPPPPPTARLKVGPLQITIPQQQYIVESSRASPQLLEQTLAAPPVQRLDRSYTLDEIRRNGRLRDMVRRVDVDTITFDTGQATVADDQIQAMQAIGGAIRELVTRDPTQIILVEGHTDAVGSDLSNLALSDRRAETVAEILSYYFGVPPENLVTQGYGEQFLKIPTVAAERQNRRVAFRNISDLLRGGQ
ncbi:MAG TPA: OmpA family protein [Bauldia sp.]